MASPAVPLDPHVQTLLSHLFDLHAEAEELGQSLVANGVLALIMAIHLPHGQQQVLSLRPVRNPIPCPRPAAGV